MNRPPSSRLARCLPALLAGLGLASVVAACGGGGSAGGPPTGIVLVQFEQSGLDNVPLNRTLRFQFSSEIDPATVSPESIQIRQGPSYGLAVAGDFVVQGDIVLFEPRLPGRCDLSDSGLKAGTEYRVTVIGSPEEFAIRSTGGIPLQATVVDSFKTRVETDPGLFEDEIPGVLPQVVATSPGNSEPNVTVAQGNKVTIQFSENVAPCTVDTNSVLFYQYATGPFADTDATPSIPETWGTGTATTPPRRILANFDLEQGRQGTVLTISPTFGQFPDDALLVVRLTNQIRDFGGSPLVPFALSFTTQDLPMQTGVKVMRYDGDVLFQSPTTADVNTVRAPSKVEGFVLFTGDADNGATPGNLTSASGPDKVGSCTPFWDPNPRPPIDNDGILDALDATSPVTLSTGTAVNTCVNTVDGSTAVVFEYSSFRIRTNQSVTITGPNPAIILVRGDILIEPGGRLLVRSTAADGATGPTASLSTSPTPTAGGTGVAGGGAGGRGTVGSGTIASWSENGQPGYGSPAYDPSLPAGSGGATAVRAGAGRGAQASFTAQYPGTRAAPSGGGGGHALAGGSGQFLNGANNNNTNTYLGSPVIPDGAGGTSYGERHMYTPEAGSGGGSGGSATMAPYTTAYYVQGGGGGAGGGFVDLTSSGNIRIEGSIFANGGNGGFGACYSYYIYGGGGGAGSGGGIRLLTTGQISFGTGAVLTVGGGTGGGGQTSGTYYPVVFNVGGNGAYGRIVFEDADGVIDFTPVTSPNVTMTPSPIPATVFLNPDSGLYKGAIDLTRFKGGGRTCIATTQIMDMGPFNPSYVPPVAADFVAGIPVISARPGVNATSILIEACGFPANADGTPDLTNPTGTGWKTVGYFSNSGNELLPNWTEGATPLDVTVPPGNTGNSITSLNGLQWVKFRMSFYLSPTMPITSPGPYIDTWSLRFTFDQ